VSAGYLRLDRLVKSYEGRGNAVDGIDLDIARGEFVTLLGPSGSGKTSTLMMVAGFEQPTAGRILLNGRDVTGQPPYRRNIGVVFQSYALFPHMTVFDNVAYGLRVRRMNTKEIEKKVHWALGLVQMTDFGKRTSSKLSGGQQQRVALARAFVFSPSVLLFDEPLSNLDAKLRAEMRIELRELQHRIGITSLYVTHDLEEALAISDRIVVMRDGLVEQIGSPTEIYNLPRNAFVADFVGSSNLIRGRLRSDLRRGGLVVLETPGGNLIYGTEYGRPTGPEGLFSVRTVHMQLSRRKPAAEINVWPARVLRRVFQGDFTQYHVGWEDRELVIRSSATDLLGENEPAWLAVDPERCVLLET
jgi:iron(III) transport system ATP-binding protein